MGRSVCHVLISCAQIQGHFQLQRRDGYYTENFIVQTSIPIGGENTNAVIAGHRGWGGAAYFRYITELQPGDEVIITNLWGTLTYRVAETQIIWPYEVDQILIQENRDLITLLTCHPYASGGKQRYLVICERAG